MGKDLQGIEAEYIFFAAYRQKDTEQENWQVNGKPPTSPPQTHPRGLALASNTHPPGDMLSNFLHAPTPKPPTESSS
jgi:hypothetical protein